MATPCYTIESVCADNNVDAFDWLSIMNCTSSKMFCEHSFLVHFPMHENTVKVRGHSGLQKMISRARESMADIVANQNENKVLINSKQNIPFELTEVFGMGIHFDRFDVSLAVMQTTIYFTSVIPRGNVNKSFTVPSHQ